MEALTAGAMDSAKASVNLAIGLIGYMAFFLGLMKVAEEGGLLKIIARVLRPLMVRLFPDVPPDHPAMGAMILNMSANALGLGNAATPFGIRAMQELDKLNPRQAVRPATRWCCSWPSTPARARPAALWRGRACARPWARRIPAGIIPSTLVATACCSTIGRHPRRASLYSALLAAAAGAPRPGEAEAEATPAETPAPAAAEPLPTDQRRGLSGLGLLCGRCWAGPGLADPDHDPLRPRPSPPGSIPVLIMVGLLTFGVAQGRTGLRGHFVEGAKDGFEVALRIIPYLVAILTAVAMFRASAARWTRADPAAGRAVHRTADRPAARGPARWR